MTRHGLGILVAIGSAGPALVAASACGDFIDRVDPVFVDAGQGGNGGGGGGGGTSGDGGPDTSNANKCTYACCPTDPSCYSDPAKVQNSPGAECLAVRDNTGQPHIQMRQTWLRPITPKGNTIPIVYGNLNNYTNLDDPACRTPLGTSGYMQIIDFDLSDSDPTKNVSTVGYATYVTDTAAAKKDGLVMAKMDAPGWTDKTLYNGAVMDFSLPASQMTSSAGYPAGLPAPMPQPWTFQPTKAKRLANDFDLTNNKDRVTLLKMFDTSDPASIARPENGGFSGVFFYDGVKGYSHGFSPLAWQVIYDPPATAGSLPTSFILVPIREAETKATFNDPKHPDCVGRFRADGLDPSNNCKLDYSDPAKPPFQGWPGVDDTLGEGSANVHGYFLITELEQIFSSVLQSTLCVSYPTSAKSITDGWATSSDKRCRAPTNTNKWDPANNGIPMGDWCASTNSKSDANCHDAYSSVSFHSFSGFPIKLDSNTPAAPVVAPVL